MDPFTIVGIVDNVMQIIQFAGEVAARLKWVYDEREDIWKERKDLRDIRETFHSVAEVVVKADEHAVNIEINASASSSDSERLNTLSSLLRSFKEEREELAVLVDAVFPRPDDGRWVRASKAISRSSKKEELKHWETRLKWYQETIATVMNDVKGTNREVVPDNREGCQPPPFVSRSQLQAPLFDYSEFQQYDKLQKEFKSEANGNAQDLAWKTVLLDLGAEQELLEEYLSWVQAEKTRREPPDLPLYFSRTSLATEVMERALDETQVLEDLQEQLVMDRQEVLFDQGVNRHKHGKTTRDEREVWERIIKVRKENLDGSVLEKYELRRRGEREEGETTNTLGG